MDMNKTVENLNFNESVVENCSYVDIKFELGFSNTRTAKLLHLIVSPVVLLLGIPGNILTIIVILRQRKLITSTAAYLLMLAISDTVFLFVGNLVDWLHTLLHFQLRDVNGVLCKVTEFLYVTSSQFSSWLLISITIDRIICIIWPHRYRQLCSTLLTKVCGLVIWFALVVLSSHVLYGSEYSDTTCGPIDEEPYLTFYTDYWPWIDMTIFFGIPFLVLSVGNAVILIKLIQKHYAKKQVGVNVPKNPRSIGSIAGLIVGLNCVFLVSTAPLCVLVIYKQALSHWVDEVNMCIDPSEHEYRRGVVDLMFSLAISVANLNSSTNFILYVLSGSKFRKEIKALLFCKPVGRENVF